ncbi:MAG: PDZ domain-containing protein, partial [Planctomycetota bacterium]
RNGIELKFELPNLRNRMIGRHERQSSRLLTSLSTVSEPCGNSVAEVLDSKQQVVALATAIEPKGLLLTKASELDGRQDVTLRMSGGRLYPASVLRIDQAHDLAVLKTSAQELNPIRLDAEPADEGAFLVTVGAGGKPLALGSLSHAPRALPANEQSVLGIQPQDSNEGCELVEVTRGGAADRAGLRVGDVVLAIDSHKVTDVTELVNEIRRRRPGTSVSLEVLRRGQRQVVIATLAARNVSPDTAARFKMMNRLGAIPSGRAEDFPWVLQHDTPLFPEQCGGPLLDLEGKVVGINIARQGRISSLAIPTSYLVELLPDLTRDEVARK